MKILAIETSCDETAVAIVEGVGGKKAPRFRVLANTVNSQISLHKKWGGVVPNIARREHQKQLIPVLLEALTAAGLLQKQFSAEHKLPKSTHVKISNYLAREEALLEELCSSPLLINAPDIDAIAVTYGPGLEPALWVGVNFARALSILWDKPLIPTNHMAGHIAAALLEENNPHVHFPAIALLVSGGHTEIVLIKKWGDYRIIGETQDDAAGEAFDKVARMLGLGYPGGPKISKLAKSGNRTTIPFPRPMLTRPNLHFSFSGLKTAVLYYLRDHKRYNKADVAAAFEDAAVDVLVAKTLHAAEQHNAKSIIIGGGVAANAHLRNELTRRAKKRLPKTAVFLPSPALTTDNAAMIGAAAYLNQKTTPPGRVRANANLRL